jgi:hypothetical protein
MSLTKKPTITAERVAASRANGRRSHGPATRDGRERIRAANIRHGFYSEAENVALTCLGEDTADLERLRTNLHNGLQLPSALEVELAEHLTQVVWRWRRAGRMQEGYALRLAKEANLTREERLHARMMRLKMTEESLRLLAQSVAREYYITPSADLEKMKRLHQEGVVKEMGEIALALFYRLEEPREKDEDGLPIDEMERARMVVAQVKEIFGIGMTSPKPTTDVAPDSSQPQESQQPAGAVEAEEEGPPSRLTPEEWEARERARQLLENILTRQVEICAAQRKAILKESLAGPSPYERAAEIALAHPNAALMQRMEESSFRQIWRITNLLLKINREAR